MGEIGSKVVLRGMSTGALEIVSTKRMERIFRHGDVAYDVDCLITIGTDSYARRHYHPEIRALLSQYELVFGSRPLGRPLDRGFEHTIELEAGVTLVIITPYRHPKRFKNKIGKEIKDLLEMGHICPNTSLFS